MKKIVAAVLIMAMVLSLGGPAASAQSPAELACTGAGGTYTKSVQDDPNTKVDETVAGGCAGETGEIDLLGQGGIFSRVINALIFITGAIAVVMLIIGGLRYVISSGDQNAVTSAKNTILYAVIGLVIVFIAGAAVRFLVGALG